MKRRVLPEGKSLLLVMLALSLAVPALGGETGRSGSLGAVFEEVVLSVGDSFLTRSELELESRVVLLLAEGGDGAFRAISTETVSAVMEYVVNQLVVLQEVERLQVFEAEPEAVTAEYARLFSNLEDPDDLDAFLCALDIGAERIVATLRRNLRVQRYLESRLRLTVDVSDDEVIAHYVANQGAHLSGSLEENKDRIRALLFRRKFEDKVRQMVFELRARTDVRVLSDIPSFPELRVRGRGERGAACVSSQGPSASGGE